MQHDVRESSGCTVTVHPILRAAALLAVFDMQLDVGETHLLTPLE
jgi:hypothetical protein